MFSQHIEHEDQRLSIIREQLLCWPSQVYYLRWLFPGNEKSRIVKMCSVLLAGEK